MIHYMILNPETFTKVESREIRATLNLFEDKWQQIKPEDQIVFTISQNQNLIATVKVWSVITAVDLQTLFMHISPEECGYPKNYPIERVLNDLMLVYPTEKQKASGVIGVRFSLIERPLSDVQVSIEKIELDIVSRIKEDTVQSYALLDWYKWHCHQKFDTRRIKNNLEAAIHYFDRSISTYVLELSIQLYREIDKAGYDIPEQYLGKKFNVYDMYPITVWWDETRVLIKQHYNGLQGRLDACEYDTAFDSEE